MTIVDKLRAWADRLETTALPVAVIVAEARALADDAEKEAAAELPAAELPAVGEEGANDAGTEAGTSEEGSNDTDGN